MTNQHRTTSFNLKHLAGLVRHPSWLRGSGFLIGGTVLNIVALILAPVMVVQPMGALSLIVAVLIGMTARRLKFKRRVLFAVLACTAGVGLFVALAALNATSPVLYGTQARYVTVVTLGLVVIFGIIAFAWKRTGHLIRILAAGMLFGCVAASVHLVGQQYLDGGITAINWETFIGIVTASALGTWFVQSAYASGPPELVIAGLTVIDPIVAVVVGAVVLKEGMALAPLVLGLMVLCAVAAILGVLVLSKYHPDVIRIAHSDEPAEPTPLTKT
ncbi:multidrug transporter [Spelaeicoccus albus]|uniref:Uncharacterized membrane protein (DUF485 family) n=1 Tax=Spelaeicoccus albus TaxID=1280376 RepID=A0A7Z0D3J8_9MICO|nr:multidrug transporter [Spelaeicoccus albus]NYI68214.1 uncharacterized membrane protein (DUF485 family) [Spelaeicoccus albus]